MKKGKISYNSLIRSVLRVPFRQKETLHVGRDISVIENQQSGTAGDPSAGAAFLGIGEVIADSGPGDQEGLRSEPDLKVGSAASCAGNEGQKKDPESALGTTINTTIYGGRGKEALAFYRGINGALAQGLSLSEGSGCTLALTFPAETSETAVKETMSRFQALAEKEKISILGGHTSFSNQVMAPVMTVSVTGRMKKKALAAVPRPGDGLILTNFPGDAGVWVLCQEEKEKLLNRYTAGFLGVTAEVEDHLSVGPAVEALASTPWMHDISEGGIFGALWEMTEGYAVGFSVSEEAIPFHQETIEICNELDQDPYELLSTGCLLIASGQPEKDLEALQKAGIPAALIGTVEAGHGKKIYHGEEIRNLDRPGQDGVMKTAAFG